MMTTNLSKLIKEPCGSGISAPTYEQELKTGCIIGHLAEKGISRSKIENTILLICRYMKDHEMTDYNDFMQFLINAKISRQSDLTSDIYSDEIIQEIKQLKGEQQ